jgi:hypothetical protein
MKRIGQGTGITRFASGMYFGGPSTVEHYLNDYKHLNAAEKRFYHKGVEINSQSPAYPVMQHLATHRFDYNEALAHFEGNEKALSALKVISPDEGKSFDFEVESGVCHEVKLPGVDDADMLRWNAEMDHGMIMDIAYKLANKLVNHDSLSSYPYDELEVTPADDFDELADNAFDAALEVAMEDGDLGWSCDDEALRELWRCRLMGDSVFDNHMEDDFSYLESTPQWKAINNVLNGKIDVHEEMTNGDVYEAVAHALSQEITSEDSDMKGKILASEFLSKKMGIAGFKCESVYGLEGSMEYVVIDENILNRASFTPLRHSEFEIVKSNETTPLHADNSREPEFHHEPDQHYRYQP